MCADEANLAAVSRVVAKMPGRQERQTVEQTIDVLFEVAAAKMGDDTDKEVLANLRKHINQVTFDLYRPKPRYIDAFFFPNQANVTKLERYIKMAKRRIMICVFNLTNDTLANAIRHVKRQGVEVRLITDDETLKNKGNDCQALANDGIPTRTDDDERAHMHNKFMVVDDEFLLTGSFNWTFQAGSSNQENLLVVDHPFYIERYQAEFEKLWTQFAPNEVRAEEKAAKTIQKAYRGKMSKRSNNNAAASSSAPGYKFQGW